MANIKKRQNILTKTAQLAIDDLGKVKSKSFIEFINGFYETAPTEDLVASNPSRLYAIAKSMRRFMEKRKPGTAKVKVFNPTLKRDGWTSNNTIIQIANDDMPFLVDSISGGLSVTERLNIFTMHHPQFFVERKGGGACSKICPVGKATEAEKQSLNTESLMFIEIEKVSDPKRLKHLEAMCLDILSDVRLSVRDWRSIVNKVDETISALAKYPPPIDPEDVDETREFINWLSEDNFIFLGYREYRFEGNPLTADFKAVRGSGMGILSNPGRFILRGPKGLTSITHEIRDFLTQPDPIIITKGNVKTQVHRPVHLDYIGVKIFNPEGKCIGERRFVGLFTSQSYSKTPLEIPLIRRKVENIQWRTNFVPGSHASKSLAHILETFPRDELFQISEDDLFEVSLGILHLSERPQPKAFARADRFERFVSALVYVPREGYNSVLRRKIEAILCEAFNGEISVYYAQLSETVLARWHFIIRTKPGQVPQPDMDEVNAKIEAAAKVWADHLLDKLVERNGVDSGKRLHKKYKDIFSIGYQEAFLPHRAATDILCLEALNEPDDIVFDVYRLVVDNNHVLRLKIYHASEVVPLSQCLPMLENLGLNVIDEHAYEMQNEFCGCIHDFYMESKDGKAIDASAVKSLVEETLNKIWNREIEDDGLNALAVCASFSSKEITILRAYSKYLRQIGLSYSQDYVEDCLVENASVSKSLVELFDTLFNPKGSPKNKRVSEAKAISNKIRGMLDQISSLDQDRILRNILNVLLATLRTNFYKTEYIYGVKETGVQPGLAFKLRSSSIEELPKPKPHAEIFVYSPRFEGVHLRGGSVARGGLRWSDRPEDFRTEVLGLVKAQQVKNAVIVPVGAKGGFYAKHLGETSGREEFMAEGVACYKSFITSLLTVTDNLVSGKVVPPNKVVRWDKGDPYLVVAADKGTATFSDIANSLAIANDFWLGDAFASGGSIGYDHKKMGITAKGAWVSVERHFRELGINVSKDPISVIGIGDMSGDVFGNGMLLSKVIRLNVAFDHRHIFFDPDPDLLKSYNERKRLFNLPRSSWENYNKKLISKGGGIFPRDAKSIKLTPEFKSFLGVEANEYSPTDLINQILKSEADLLWFGGIGTYVKASSERHTEAGDRANDGLRVNGKDLKVRVVGEGGNLGMTQRSRIEFAQNGGRLNTDFIDNSAGVDCSDKEVNIKILLASAVEKGKLNPKDRPKLLSSMTREVSKIVLEDNYLQTQAISIAETLALTERENHAGLIRILEKEDRLDREIENLPSEEQFSELALNGQGLTRPELSVLISYAKMSLNDLLLQSDIIKNPILKSELEWGFPDVLVEKYGDSIDTHQLKSEIIATTLANEVINRGGLTFVYDVWEETGLAVDQIVSAFLIVRDAFGLVKVWEDIDKLDYKVEASIQIMMHNQIAEFTKHQATWFLRNMPIPLDISGQIGRYKQGLEKLMAKFERVLSPMALDNYKEKVQNYTGMKVPQKIAKKIACLEAMGAACDIVNVAEDLRIPVEDVALAYFDVGHRVGFDWLRSTAEAITPDDHWERLAVNAIVDDLADQQRELTSYILKKSGAKGSQAVGRWLKTQVVILARSERLINDLKGSGASSIAKVSFAARHIRTFLPI